jgi:hypothetical protein
MGESCLLWPRKDTEALVWLFSRDFGVSVLLQVFLVHVLQLTVLDRGQIILLDPDPLAGSYVAVLENSSPKLDVVGVR